MHLRKALREGFEPSRGVSPTGSPGQNKEAIKQELEDYLSLRQIEGISESWLERIEVWLNEYLDYVDWAIDKQRSLMFLKAKQREYSTTTYRKMVYQVRKFLSYLGVGWAHSINPPAEPEYRAKRVTKQDVQATIEYVSETGERYVALALLGATSGMRAEELYQLTLDDIDLEDKMVEVKHDPDNGQTTKTKKSRVAFFNDEAKEALLEYLPIYEMDDRFTRLFSKRECERAFEDAPLYVKDLRKFFSQEWDRQGGPTTIKKILMGHSLKGDVDLNHYNAQSEEDLKRIYDAVEIKTII